MHIAYIVWLFIVLSTTNTKLHIQSTLKPSKALYITTPEPSGALCTWEYIAVFWSSIYYKCTFLGVDKIDSLTLSVPADGIDSIGIGAHSVNEDEVKTEQLKEDPRRTELSEKMLQLWDHMTEKLKNNVVTMGLCDLETDIFFHLFKVSSVKPNNFQVNLKSCCVVPPDLQAFAKENQIKLHTHADPPSVLSPDFMENVESDSRPEWIIRYQLFIKSRGVLQDKRYLIQA